MKVIYRIFMYIIGSIAGAGIGLGLSLVTMVMLTMISTDKIINTYFGVCFLLLGVMMLAKLYRKNKIVNIDLGSETPTKKREEGKEGDNEE